MKKELKSLAFGSIALASMALATSCGGTKTAESKLTASGLDPEAFDTAICVSYNYDAGAFEADEANAKQVELHTLKNANGMEVCITNFGGRIVSIMVPNKDGQFVDVAAGFDKVENYFPWNYATDYGSSVGRYANRIDGGKFVCGTDTITLDKNNNDHACLHGGFTGWQYQVYDVVEKTDNTLKLHIATKGEVDNKFPGDVDVTILFALTDDNAIEISYDGTTDKETILNMTNHTYFNLSGDFNNTICDALLTVNADNYTPADEFYIPTGEIRPVAGTVFDFRTAKKIGLNFPDNDPEIVAAGGGYDHNWCLNTNCDETKVAVTLSDPRSGIKMDVYTNEPGIQCYTANFQDSSCPGKNGIMYPYQCAICLESQKYPDSPNKWTMEGWGEKTNPFISPEKPYHSYCKYAFSVEK